MKAFLKSRKGLLIALCLTVAAAVYAVIELNAIPGIFQRVFLPAGQTAPSEAGGGAAGKATNQYLRRLIDDAQTVNTALDGSCAPTSLYAVAQPAAIGTVKQKNSVNARLTAIDENYLELQPFTLYSGRYFYPDEYLRGEKVALLDEQLAVALFQYAEPLLEEIAVNGVNYRIIGIVRDHKQVGDEMDYGAYVPYRSLMAGSLKMTAVVYEAKPVQGAGGWAAFTSAAASLGTTGTTISLTKEVMNAKMPLRLLLALGGGTLAFFAVSVLNRLLRRLTRRYQIRLRNEYAAKLLGWVSLRGLGLLVGYALCALVLARLFMILVEPVFSFPEWVPAILVEPKDIAAAFWNVWQKPAAVVELRTPELLRVRFYRQLLGWACGLGGVLLGVCWGGVKNDLRRLCRMDEPLPDWDDPK